MRRLGQLLIGTGVVVGVGVAGAMALHLGVAGVPWLVNVALAKLALAGSAGLMGAGAIGIRLANRRDQSALLRGGGTSQSALDSSARSERDKR